MLNFSAFPSLQAHDQAVNGASLHPYLPLLATASGERRFMEPLDDNDNDDSDAEDDDNDGDDGNYVNDNNDEVNDDKETEGDQPLRSACEGVKATGNVPSTSRGDSCKNQLRKRSRDPVWRRVMPASLDNSLKIWRFP